MGGFGGGCRGRAGWRAGFGPAGWVAGSWSPQPAHGTPTISTHHNPLGFPRVTHPVLGNTLFHSSHVLRNCPHPASTWSKRDAIRSSCVCRLRSRMTTARGAASQSGIPCFLTVAVACLPACMRPCMHACMHAVTPTSGNPPCRLLAVMLVALVRLARHFRLGFRLKLPLPASKPACKEGQTPGRASPTRPNPPQAAPPTARGGPSPRPHARSPGGKQGLLAQTSNVLG